MAHAVSAAGKVRGRGRGRGRASVRVRGRFRVRRDHLWGLTLFLLQAAS